MYSANPMAAPTRVTCEHFGRTRDSRVLELHVAAIVDENACRLHIPVHHALVVCVLQFNADLEQQLPGDRKRRRRMRTNHGVERDALEYEVRAQGLDRDLPMHSGAWQGVLRSRRHYREKRKLAPPTAPLPM